jgi:hypothetical protein
VPVAPRNLRRIEVGQDHKPETLPGNRAEATDKERLRRFCAI